MNKIRVFEAFSGYGSQSMALRNIGVDYEVVGISEIDKYAIKAYESTHGEVNNLGDISKIKVDDIPEHDLFTYSFPCQDISVAGVTKGIERGKTRSGLLYECERIIEHCKPKYLLMENVKNLVGKKFKPQFDEWLRYLENLGYTNYWQVLNAKDYGIPQNRERVFVVSILGEHKPYKFPEKIKLEKKVKDLLESDVNPKYYLSEEKVKKLTLNTNLNENRTKGIKKIGVASKNPHSQAGQVVSVNGVSVTICAGTHGYAIGYIADEYELPCIGASRGRNPENPTSRVSGLPTEQRLEINTKGVSNTLTTVQKDNYVIENYNTLKFVGGIGDKDRVGDGKKLSRNFPQGNRVYDANGIAVAQTSNGGGLAGPTGLYLLENLKIRKLTPRECFRLMGVSEEDIDKIQTAGISETQQYKMAGNSIVVPVLEGIFRELFL